MLIGKDKIREIVERTDIVQVIGRHVELKRAGRSFKGLCPFHGEKTPSFVVTPERRSYKCFGCQKGGDVIRFVMEYEGKDFVAAVRQLAALSGVPISFDPEEDRRLQERRELLWACDVARKFFEEILWSPRGAPGRAHLDQRGISEATAREVGLGYAPLSWTELRDRLAAEKVPAEVAVGAGLLGHKEDDRGARTYDVFRGRLMIPIRDPDGRVVAFGGRVIEGEDDRKYINTRETALYTKGRVLWGLDVARDAIRRAGEATLAEGYFDAIALREAGVRTAVALCSTALTADHLSLLQRLEVRRVHLVLDGDEAGRKASVRLAGPLLAAGLSTKVVALPDGHDPDTFLHEAGPDGYRRLVEAAAPLSAYVIDRALSGRGSGYEDRMAALQELTSVVAHLPAGASRSLFFAELAKAVGIPAADVERSYRGAHPEEAPGDERNPPAPGRPPATSGSASRAGHGPPGPPTAGAPHAAAHAPRSSGPPPRRAELALVGQLLAHPGQRERFAREAATALSHEGLRELAALLAGGSTPDEILERVEPSLRQLVAGHMRSALRGSPEHVEAELRGGLLRVEEARLGAELAAVLDDRAALEGQLARSEADEERQELGALVAEQQRQIAALRELREKVRQQLRGDG